ncbi:MAG: hypothetical protein LBW85_01190 [Deltaproteobacteria bacterium]|jgi:hypothetical protein|nr:hypothetical protein [Deltaproteobacteria bacterium]
MALVKFNTNIELAAAPNALNHAARLGDVYDVVASRVLKPALAATTGDLAGTYASAAKTLTAGADGPLTVDGVSPAAGDRVLLVAQVDATQNGVYEATDPGGASAPWILARAPDFDATSKIFTGVKIHVMKGASYAEATFVLTTDEPVLDTTSLTFVLDTGKIEAVLQKSFAIAGNGTQTDFPFTHGWNTRAVTVDVYDSDPGGDFGTVFTEVNRSSLNAITVKFAVAPSAGETFAVIVRALANA